MRKGICSRLAKTVMKSASPEKVQLPLPLAFRPALGRGDFLVSACNADAVAWIDRWPSWTYPHLVIYGPEGCGKTHLAHVFVERSGALVLSAPDEVVLAFLIHESRAVVFEGADKLAGNPDGERFLFHLMNLQKENGSSLLMISDTAPSAWGVHLPDLRSRLLAAQVAGIEAPDDALLEGVFLKLFADRRVDVDADVVQYVLPRIQRSFAGVKALVESLDAAALSKTRRITIPLARDVLAEKSR